MGGEAAKERRRLKRLQQQSDGDAASAVNPGSESPNKRTGSEGSSKTLGSDAALMRLRRKMERKSSGKFKAQSVSKPAILPSNSMNRDARIEDRGRSDNTQWKRRREDGNHDDGRNGRHKGDNNNKGWRRGENHDGGRNGRHRGDNNNREWRSRDDKRGGKPREKPYKKKTIAKHKVQKPKHLKRKLGQLSKAMSAPAEGNTVADLEGQMKDLIQKMEEYKKLKTAASAESKQDDVKTEARNNEEVIDTTEDEGASGDEGKITRGDEKGGADTKAESKQEDEVKTEAGNKRNQSSSSSNEREAIDTTDKGEGSGDSDSISDSSSDSSSSDDDSIVASDTRTRGKRRRGRRESQQSRDSAVEENEDEPPKVALNADGEKEVVEESGAETSAKKTSKKDDKRRCIGRKPVTDYVVGQTYTGTVRQIEPRLGAFIDIGSHSDAFCHISCVSDKYTKNIEDFVKLDDVLSNVRVLEIDRQRKRITVSLRSLENAENEQERLKSTRQFEEKNERPSPRKHQRSPKSGHTRFDGEKPARVAVAAQGDVTVKPRESPAATVPVVQPSKQKPGADLKRERKLQRRAERRAEREASAS